MLGREIVAINHTTKTQMTLLISAALVVVAVMIRFWLTRVRRCHFSPLRGYLLVLVGYAWALLAGNLFEGA